VQFPDDMPTAEQAAEMQTYIQDLNDVINGEGRHTEHFREQIGRCVHCSCGRRAQGRMSQADIAFSKEILHQNYAKD
jgi:hypothetical protein